MSLKEATREDYLGEEIYWMAQLSAQETNITFELKLIDNILSGWEEVIGPVIIKVVNFFIEVVKVGEDGPKKCVDFLEDLATNVGFSLPTSTINLILARFIQSGVGGGSDDGVATGKFVGIMIGSNEKKNNFKVFLSSLSEFALSDLDALSNVLSAFHDDIIDEKEQEKQAIIIQKEQEKQAIIIQKEQEKQVLTDQQNDGMEVSEKNQAGFDLVNKDLTCKNLSGLKITSLEGCVYHSPNPPNFSRCDLTGCNMTHLISVTKRWEDLKGKTLQNAITTITNDPDNFNVVTLAEGTAPTTDFDITRVRIWYNNSDIVSRIPIVG